MKNSNNNSAKQRRFVRWFWTLILVPTVAIITIIILTAAGTFGRLPSFVELENPESNLATEIVRQILRTVANTQQGFLTLDLRQIDLRSVLITHRGRATGENHTDILVQIRDFVVGVNLAIDVQFAHAASNKLRVLRTEVED